VPSEQQTHRPILSEGIRHSEKFFGEEGATTPNVKNSTLRVGRGIRRRQVTAGSCLSEARIGGRRPKLLPSATGRSIKMVTTARKLRRIPRAFQSSSRSDSRLLARAGEIRTVPEWHCANFCRPQETDQRRAESGNVGHRGRTIGATCCPPESLHSNSEEMPPRSSG
jgi:hypothetical protein